MANKAWTETLKNPIVGKTYHHILLDDNGTDMVYLGGKRENHNGKYGRFRADCYDFDCEFYFSSFGAEEVKNECIRNSSDGQNHTR